MKIGFVGAGKAGCSLGKYFSEYGKMANVQVTGYYSLLEDDSRWAAEFTNSTYYADMDLLVSASDIVILSTPDGAIKDTWNAIHKEQIDDKIFCHLSGSLSSDIFSGIEHYHAYGISVHPFFAFSNRDSVYKQLHKVSFTLEGHPVAVDVFGKIFSNLNNPTIQIKKDLKPCYHAAASLLSNHVIAVLHTGYDLLMQCGFSEEEARTFSSLLVKENVENVLDFGCVKALTGPIERKDVETVKKHFEVLNESQRRIYKACGRELIEIAQEKNPDEDYESFKEIMSE